MTHHPVNAPAHHVLCQYLRIAVEFQCSSLTLVVCEKQLCSQSPIPCRAEGAQCGAKFASNEALKSVSYPIQARWWQG